MEPLLLLVLALLVGYVAACAIWPYRACPRCTGTGRQRSPTGAAWRPCRRCDGSGRRVRTGRLLYELLVHADDR